MRNLYLAIAATIAILTAPSIAQAQPNTQVQSGRHATCVATWYAKYNVRIVCNNPHSRAIYTSEMQQDVRQFWYDLANGKHVTHCRLVGRTDMLRNCK